MSHLLGISNTHAEFHSNRYKEVFKFSNEGFNTFSQKDWKMMYQKGGKALPAEWWVDNPSTILCREERYEKDIYHILCNIMLSRTPQTRINSKYVPMSVDLLGKEGLPFYYDVNVNNQDYIVELFETSCCHSPFTLCDMKNGATIYEKVLSSKQFVHTPLLINIVTAAMNSDDLHIDFTKDKIFITRTLQLQRIVEEMMKQFYHREGPYVVHVVIKLKLQPPSIGKRNGATTENSSKRRKVIANQQDIQEIEQQKLMLNNNKRRKL